MPRLFHQVWGWNGKDVPKRRILPTILHGVFFIKPEDGTERYPETSHLSYNIRPCQFHQVWSWNRQISRNVVSFPQYYATSVSSSLRMGSKDIPKRRIFPTIFQPVCFNKSEDGTERYPETSYHSYNIRPRHNPKCYNNKNLFFAWLDSERVRGGVVLKALRYKPAGRGFDSRWCHWNSSMT
jgi:hypothetical protein